MIEEAVYRSLALRPADVQISDFNRVNALAGEFVKALNNCKEGGVLEIGVFEAGSTLMFLDLMFELKDLRPLQSVDCYDSDIAVGYVDTYFTALYRMVTAIGARKVIWRQYPVSDTIYMDCIHPKLSSRFQKFAFVYLDGPHDEGSILKEVDYFADHVLLKGSIVIDDVSLLNKVGRPLLAKLKGWNVYDVPNAIVCRRTK